MCVVLDIFDQAILQSGLLDKIVFVGLPKPSDRFEILKTITKVCVVHRI